MLTKSTTSSDTSSVMIVITTRISTSVKPFLRFIAPPTMRLGPPSGAAGLFVLDAPSRSRRGRIPAVIAPGAPHVEAVGMQHRRALHRGLPRLRGPRLPRHLIVAVVDPDRGRLAVLAVDRVEDVPLVQHVRGELEVLHLLGALLLQVERQVLAVLALPGRVDG